MTLAFHPAVQSDFNDAIAYYQDIAGDRVADRFEAEIRETLAEIVSSPRRFPFYGSSRLWRRARPRSFPYMIVYRELPAGVLILVIKHERRRQSYGMRRR